MCKVEGRLITKLEEQLQAMIADKMRETTGRSNLSIRQQKAGRSVSKSRGKTGRDRGQSSSRRKDSHSEESRRRSRSGSSDEGRKKKSRKASPERREADDKQAKARSTHSHSADEEIDESLYVDVPVEAFLLKKNFDYILIDKEDILEYTGKSETKISQVLKVPYHGTLQLVSHFISQMYADSRFDMKSDEEAVIINEEIFITKNDVENMLVFKWVASQKNDIIADCLAYMFSQFPQNRDFDIFNIDTPKTGKDGALEAMQKRVSKRVLNTLHGYIYRVDRHYMHFREGPSEFTINLRTGKIDCRDDELASRVKAIVGNLF